MFRKLGLVFLFTIFSIKISAQTNSLVVFSSNGSVFQLKVDNEIINKVKQSNVKAIDLSTGSHHLEISEFDDSGVVTVLKDSIFIGNELKYSNKEFTYVLESKDKKPFLVFKSISGQSGPSSPPIPEAPKEIIPLVDNSLYGNLYQAKNNIPVFFNHYDILNSSCEIKLSDMDLKYAVNLLKKCNDIETEFRYLNQIIKNNCLTSNQLKDLLALLTMDMDRLTIAKLAYSHLIDKENSKEILSVFKYPAMKESYVDFMKEQENKIKQKNLHCSEPMPDSKFGELLSKIKNTTHENEKYQLAKKLIVDVCISSMQIKQITPFFTHDRDKLDFLVSAHLVLTDKENAKLLISEFQSSEAKEEYLNLISKQ